MGTKLKWAARAALALAAATAVVGGVAGSAQAGTGAGPYTWEGWYGSDQFCGYIGHQGQMDGSWRQYHCEPVTPRHWDLWVR
ncbi:hypothetical protein Afil01_17770 [Actinorhabdospora filicis]|uniref:Chitin-binding type-3 domain-containing protein n=1 Tax=Actinorhabdospora filicis TaxID=1785913 RepID=A0A9W6W9U4_9ACTN|nr:hypothetical protein [Actinorhabdospora filicis]GLZ76970.1 hypothetical protein Afil01_17770 [Actinorhabdospora filicis]